MWLRFRNMELPADQAVALVPKADLLVIGLRVMVLPALATGGVLLAMASIRRGGAREFDRLSRGRASLEPPVETDPASNEAQRAVARMRAIDERLGQLRERPRPLDALPAQLRRPAAIALVVVVVLLILVVPFSAGAFAWPAALVGLGAYWLRLRREAPVGSGRRLPVWRIAVAGVVAASVISVARQTDPPVQLASVQALVVDAPGLSRTLGLPAPARASDPIALNGVLVTATGDEVAVGDPLRRQIVTVPRSHVSSLVIGPPLDVRAPPPSLLSRITSPDNAWAVTPLEFWCFQLRYSWASIL